MPAVSTDPGVAFIPYSAARVAGCTSKPSVSVPIDNGAKPAATPTALPEDDPQGVCNSARIRIQGLFWSSGVAHAMT